MNYIDPEDFEWSDDLYKENFNNEKCIVINNFCGLTNNGQNSHFANTQTINQETIQGVNSIQEKCCTALGESGLKFYNKTRFEESKSFTRNYSGDAVNCLYRSEEQCIDQDNAVKQNIEGNHISSEEGSLCSNKTSALISNNLEAFKADRFHDNTSLNAETISLIRNSISGVYEPPESFLSITHRSNEHEQVVPISNYITLDENENPQASFNFQNQHETIFNDENTSENNETSNSPDIRKEGANPISSTNKASSDGELLGIQSLFFKEISAYTPGGQCYKLPKRSDLCSKIKVATYENQLEVAALLNNSKKIRQIQGGMFIPETLDYNKEEDFNKWLREEKDKIISLFENFNIELNIKHLSAERELIKLDRYLKQYTMSLLLDPLEILELIEKIDVDLSNLVFTHQVYETVSKITKNCKGRLRVKSRTVLMKFKSLLSPHKGIKAEKYLNDLLLKNNANKLKPEAPAEWIVHLLTFL